MIRRPRYGFCITLALALSGCYAGTVPYAPQDNVDFAVVQEIRQLDGTYRDVSDRSVHESGDAYLVESFTEILWRSGLVAATTVEVRAAGDDRVSIRSLDRNGTVLKQQVFVAGQDFEFVDGRLRFRRSNLMVAPRNAGARQKMTTSGTFRSMASDLAKSSAQLSSVRWSRLIQ